MSCSGTTACNCSGPRCPPGYDTANSLGFVGAPSCCKFPCPAFPLHKVNICFRVVCGTCVQINQGCLVTETPGTNSDISDCTIDWTWGTVESSWGRKCRVINWNRTVPSNSFIRIRICPCNPCSTGCGISGDSDLSGGVASNGLVKFQVDGQDYVNFLQGVRDAGGQLGCNRAWCTSFNTSLTAPADCCTSGDGVISWTNITRDLPWGTEIVFGPIGGPIISLT